VLIWPIVSWNISNYYGKSWLFHFSNHVKPMLQQRIGFIGAGQMATALGQGFVRAGLTSGEKLLASDPSETARAGFANATGGHVTYDNALVASKSDVLFMAVKPQQMALVAGKLAGTISDKTLVISIAAGVTLARLKNWLGNDVRLVRVMPNTPCLIGQGACAYSLGDRATAADGELADKLLGAVGKAWLVEEKLLDAVTGLSGSGPAYVYVIVEALIDAGVRVGLPRQIAASLALETIKGAVDMVLSTGEHPAVLKDRVASPGGTTIAGLQVLEAGALRATLIAAVEAATKRSQELGAVKD
jgi:pyrroline-5-carboxylate reductase